MADRQTKAESIWLGRVECLEDFVALLAKAVAIVAHGEPEPSAFVDTAQRKVFLSGTVVIHRLAGIFDEVQENLFDGNPVRLNQGEFFGVASGNLDVRRFEVRLRHGKRLVEERVWRVGFQGRLALAEDRPQALDDIGRADIGAHDVIQDFTQFFEVGSLAGDQALRGLRIAENDRERLVDFMGQRTRKLAHRRHACDVGHLLALPFRLGRECALGTDIDTDSHEMGFSGDLHRNHSEKVPRRAAIPPRQIELHFMSALRQGHAAGLRERVPLHFGTEIFSLHSGGLVIRVSRNAFVLGIPPHHAPVGGLQIQHAGSAFEDGIRELPFAEKFLLPDFESLCQLG